MGETLEHHMKGDYTWNDLYDRYHLSDAIEFCADNQIAIHEWRNDSGGCMRCIRRPNIHLMDYRCVIAVNFIYLYEIEGRWPDLPTFVFSNTPENMEAIKRAVKQ